MKNSILFYTYGGSKNHGCEAIARSTGKILESYCELKIILSSKNDLEDHKFGIDKLYKVKIFQEKQVKKIPIATLARRIKNKLGIRNVSTIECKF